MGTTEGNTSVKSGDGTIVSTGGLVTGVTEGLAIRVVVRVGLTETVVVTAAGDTVGGTAGDIPRVGVVVVAAMIEVKSGSTE